MAETSSNNIALAFDALGSDLVLELQRKYPSRIGYIVINNVEDLLRDESRLDDVTKLRSKGLALVLDAQLAGGFEALKRRTETDIRRFYPEVIITAMGISASGLAVVVQTAKAMRPETKILTTGVLAELNYEDLADATAGRCSDPSEYTKNCALVTKKAGAQGVYGSVHDAGDIDWALEDLDYFAAGISPDGLAYSDKLAGNVSTLGAAYALGATVAVVGSALNEPRFKAETVDQKVALFDRMLMRSYANNNN